MTERVTYGDPDLDRKYQKFLKIAEQIGRRHRRRISGQTAESSDPSSEKKITIGEPTPQITGFQSGRVDRRPGPPAGA